MCVSGFIMAWANRTPLSILRVRRCTKIRLCVNVSTFGRNRLFVFSFTPSKLFSSSRVLFPEPLLVFLFEKRTEELRLPQALKDLIWDTQEEWKIFLEKKEKGLSLVEAGLCAVGALGMVGKGYQNKDLIMQAGQSVLKKLGVGSSGAAVCSPEPSLSTPPPPSS